MTSAFQKSVVMSCLKRTFRLRLAGARRYTITGEKGKPPAKRKAKAPIFSEHVLSAWRLLRFPKKPKSAVEDFHNFSLKRGPRTEEMMDSGRWANQTPEAERN